MKIMVIFNSYVSLLEGADLGVINPFSSGDVEKKRGWPSPLKINGASIRFGDFPAMLDASENGGFDGASPRAGCFFLIDHPTWMKKRAAPHDSGHLW